MISSFDRRSLTSTFGADYQWPDEPSAGVPRAAVASIFRKGENGTELLFIQRALRDNDPWSAQMAFPGGRRQVDDATPAATAKRETGEEVGLDLAAAPTLGVLTVLDGASAANRDIVVSAHGYWLPGPAPALTPNYEVADTVWISLAELANPERVIDYYFPLADATFPGIQLDQAGQVVWGLTLRMLADIFGRLKHPFVL